MTEDHDDVIKVRIGDYKYPVYLTYEGDRIFCRFKFNPALKDEIKAMEGAKWHGFEQPNPRKVWSIANSARNAFNIAFLKGENPYEKYDAPLGSYESVSGRPLYDHQKEMVAHALARNYSIFACEMGTGKTLAFIEILESIDGLQDHQAWYVGPKSGVMAVGRELVKWECKVSPRMLTYNGFTKAVQQWEDGEPAPRIICFDECSKLKTPTSQRSQAALHLANAIREEWGEAGYVLEMSGTPAPKTPVDWWHQCEVACPGYLKEGNSHKFKARLCLIEDRESPAGGVYPHIVTWLDNEEKCKHCGQYPTRHDGMTPKELREFRRHPQDSVELSACAHDLQDHLYEPSTNEVAKLYSRMQGLVLVKFKKDCLDLPDKQYKIIKIKPSVETLRAAKLIRKVAPRAITAMTLLRELSDGFQYKEIKGEEITCTRCHGELTIEVEVPDAEIDPMMTGDQLVDVGFTKQVIQCDTCNGTGVQHKMETIVDEVTTCPKDAVFKELLEDHEETGRFIVWGGFTGTIDRLVEMARREAWTVICVDGRGYRAWDHNGDKVNPNVLLDCMDLSNPKYSALREEYPKVCFVGHPKAGGMALTLTASPTELFFSNDFDGEARMQAEDRFHRAGMDKNRGATIIDLIHLPSDLVVLDNLKNKKRMQDMSMGDLESALENMSEEIERR